jgi:hypothetical protein
MLAIFARIKPALRKSIKRRWLPRHIDIDRLSDEEIQDIVITANLTPRKCLGFKTPFQAILKELGKCPNPLLLNLLRLAPESTLRRCAGPRPSLLAVDGVRPSGYRVPM